MYGLSFSLLPVLMMRKGRDYLHEKPFEHDAIIGTLWDTLFTNKTRIIVQQFPGHFKPNQEQTYALSPAMVALAATAVCTITIVNAIKLTFTPRFLQH